MKKSTIKAIQNLKIEDFQNRNGSYPQSNVPVSICYGGLGGNKTVHVIQVEFKNTNELTAIEAAERWLASWNLAIHSRHLLKTFASQEGDYTNDWVTVELHISQRRVN